jgi:hypothetical protein
MEVVRYDEVLQDVAFRAAWLVKEELLSRWEGARCVSPGF